MCILPLVELPLGDVLVASPSAGLRRQLTDSFQYPGRDFAEAAAGTEALARLQQAKWQLLLLDRQLPDVDAAELREIILRRCARLPVLLFHRQRNAPSCREGSGYCSPGPSENPRLASPASCRHSRQKTWDSDAVEIQPLPGMVGSSPAMQKVYRMARLVAPRNTTVLITGATGTGKELVAHALHQLNPRAGRPFAVINCAAIPEALLESELFGYVRGAFTGAVQSQAGRVHAAQGGRCSWMRSASCRSACRQSCCAFWNTRKSRGWGVRRHSRLTCSSEVSPPPLVGDATREPAFGVSALWISPDLENQALASGYAVVDQTSVLATHLAEVIKQHAHELLTRQESKRLLDRLSESHPKLVEELVPKILSLGEVQKVLQQLLREQVSIRDLPTILETLLDVAVVNKNPVLLVEAARQGLGRALVHPLLNRDGELRVVTLDSEFEDQLNRAFTGQVSASSDIQPNFVRRVLEGLRSLAGEHVAVATPVLLCATPGRFHLRRLLEPFLPKIVVLSPGEIPPRVQVQSVGVVR